MPEIEEYDGLSHWRCPPLGGPVGFKHCRRVNSGLPCDRILACWGARIPVQEFLQSNYSDEELEQALLTPPKNRVEIIFETLEKTKKRDF